MAGASPVIPDYQLLRPIGRGAYGEVWLARSVTGIYRAAKIVYRASFEEARPFEREFAGIQRIEPLSRAEEHQLTILHVGRNEASGYFYYLMELADDAETGEEIRPDKYVPKTLREMRARKRRLPAVECLAVGIALTRALAHLHRHGLVHRDIKPSNVIFVHGVPKLADIGLVSKVDDSVSFVGTEGFVPPEGPGSIQADLYSLGKVLYEISTGRDRKEFPRLPEDLEKLADQRALLELNEVTLKACDPEMRRRYTTAEAMHEDLLLLQAGKSVKRLHVIERRFKMAAKYGIAATAVMLMAAAAFLWASFQARKAKENFALSEHHRLLAERALRESELNQARARRMTGLAGRRFDTIELLRRLAAGTNVLELRNEAIASLALPDARQIREWKKAPDPECWTFDLHLRRYITNDASGNLFIRDVETDQELAILPGSGAPLTAMLASRDYGVIATSDRSGNAYAWNVETRRATQIDFPKGARLAGVTPDGHAIVIRRSGGALQFIEAGSGIPEKTWKGPFVFHRINFNPDGTLFYGINGADIMIHSATNGALLAKLPHPEGVAVREWHPDGRRLVSGCGSTIYFWDAMSGQRLAVMEGHESRIVGLSFDQTGGALSSTAWDHTTRLWQTDTRREVVIISSGGNRLQMSPDGRRLAFLSWDHSRAQLWEVAGKEVRRFELPASAQKTYRMTYRAGFSPDGSLLHLDSTDGVFVFDAESLQSVAVIPARQASIGLFHPSGASLITGDAKGVRFWPIKRSVEGRNVELGPPEGLSLSHGGVVNLSASLDGHHLVVGQERGYILVNTEPVSLLHAQPVSHHSVAPVLSPDGHWVGVASRGRGLDIHDAASGQIVTNLHPNATGFILFSPDGRWLLSSATAEYQFWEINSWRPGKRIERSMLKRARPCAAFTADGKVAAIAVAEDAVRLVLTGTDMELATLPIARMITHLSFSPDNRHLLVTYEPGVAELWDLGLIHAELTELKLPWSHFSPGDEGPAKSP